MVTEQELEALGRGSPGSVFLNFSLALLPLSAAFLITLLSTTIPSVGGLVFFVCACIVCFLAGLICLVLAWQNHASSRTLVTQIKSRMPPSSETPPEAPGQEPTGPAAAGQT